MEVWVERDGESKNVLTTGMGGTDHWNYSRVGTDSAMASSVPQ